MRRDSRARQAKQVRSEDNRETCFSPITRRPIRPLLARPLLTIRPEQKCAPVSSCLLEWTTRRADRIASAIGRRGGSGRARQRTVNSEPAFGPARLEQAASCPLSRGGGMPAHQLLDAAGRPRSPTTMPGHHAGRVPPNKGRRYPADPPTVDEIVAVMRQAGDTRHGRGCAV